MVRLYMTKQKRLISTDIKHRTTVQRSIPAKIGIRYDNPMACWNPIKQITQKMTKTCIVFRLKQIESMHGHWYISLREQDHAFLDSALDFIQITWSTYLFANIRRFTKGVQMAGCSLDRVTQKFHPIFWDCFKCFHIELGRKYKNMTSWPNMEKILFYDCIKFVIDFVRVWFLF